MTSHRSSIYYHRAMARPGMREKYRSRSRFRQAIKGIRTEEILGCSFKEFKKIMGPKLRNGMTWNNYGKIWEWDHIIPCYSFDWTDPRSERLCHHYSNLQPMLKSANRSKGYDTTAFRDSSGSVKYRIMKGGIIRNSFDSLIGRID